MIDYYHFDYASPPRTATTWFMNAAFQVGLIRGYHPDVHIPWQCERGYQLRITTVRHPCAWLASYFAAIYPGHVGVPCVDQFAKLPAFDFDNFVRGYLYHMPGAVWQMFQAYEADSYIRIEDLPDAAIELFRACGLSRSACQQCRNLPPQNRNGRVLPRWSLVLFDRVCEAEQEMIEYFDYENSNCHSS